MLKSKGNEITPVVEKIEWFTLLSYSISYATLILMIVYLFLMPIPPMSLEMEGDLFKASDYIVDKNENEESFYITTVRNERIMNVSGFIRSVVISATDYRLTAIKPATVREDNGINVGVALAERSENIISSLNGSAFEMKSISDEHEKLRNFPIAENLVVDLSSHFQGDSAGLMTMLQLNHSDLIRGEKIAGTGTIELDGSIGRIGGVPYKVRASVNQNVDIFLIPAYHYEEALANIEGTDTDMKIIPVETYEEAVSYLENR